MSRQARSLLLDDLDEITGRQLKGNDLAVRNYYPIKVPLDPPHGKPPAVVYFGADGKTLRVCSEDPVSDGERGPRLLEQKYQAAGIRDITVHVYPDARHELLNDTCRDAVTRDLCAWLDARAATTAARAS